MKLPNKNFVGFIALIFLLSNYSALSQDTPKGDLSITLSYFNYNNKIPYLLAKVKTKVDGKFVPVNNINLNLFLDKDSAGTVIGKVLTNDKGEATAIIPPSVKSQWISSIKHTFLAKFDGNKKYESATADLTVGKAKILIDTTSDRKITVTVMEMKDTVWTPVNGVELKIGIRRLDADLSVNEAATFTTDSTGQATVDFKRDSILGDVKGNIILVAKIEDNDQYGNLLIEQTVPWGFKFVPVNTFDRRTLFATRSKAPIWLILIATSIIVAVWAVLISLVINLVKIKKIGQQVIS